MNLQSGPIVGGGIIWSSDSATTLCMKHEHKLSYRILHLSFSDDHGTDASRTSTNDMTDVWEHCLMWRSNFSQEI